MSRISILALNEEGFVFDPTTGNSFQVSGTGLFVLKALREGKDDGQIARMLADEYQVSLDEAKRDVADFRDRLKALELT